MLLPVPSRRTALRAALLGLPLGAAAAPQKVPLLISPRLARPLWRRVFELLGRAGGWEFDLQVRPFARAELEVIRGEGLMLGLSPNAERERHLRFSRPVAEFRAWVLGPAIEAPLNLQGRRVCVARSSPSAELIPGCSNRARARCHRPRALKAMCACCGPAAANGPWSPCAAPTPTPPAAP